ncbi:MAG: mannitol dehydrogenase family protein [Pirellulales bacterium]
MPVVSLKGKNKGGTWTSLLERKPVQPFVGAGKWDDEAVMGELQRDVAEAFHDPQEWTESTPPPCETVLQFGTGKFLRCFADLFIDQTNARGPVAGRVVAVQSTGVERARLLNERAGRFRMAIRGLDAGQTVDRTVEIGSVSRALAAQTNWDDVLALARSDALRLVISNATEAGYALHPQDQPADLPPRSFPAKLLQVLKSRWDCGLAGLSILPCELVDSNGDRLLRLVLDQAERWRCPAALADWLRGACSWHNTLVDRIVSAPSPNDPMAADPLFAVAEPFALWIVEGSLDVPELAGHTAVQCVEQLGPYYLRKVRILNGAHTAFVAKARPLGIRTVREAVLDPRVGPWLEALLFEEIVPVLSGRTEEPERFARQVLERFANPFLEHRLADIALEHATKLQVRVAPTAREFRDRFGRAPRRLNEVLAAG